MNLYAYDYEVFRYDWLVVFKRITDGKYFVYHNDTAGIKDFMQQNKDCILGGFNENIMTVIYIKPFYAVRITLSSRKSTIG